MFKLGTPCEPYIRYEHKRMKLFLSYDRVLNAFAAMRDERFEDRDRIALALDILTGCNRWVWRLPQSQKIELYMMISQERLIVSARKNGDSTNPAKLFDFDLDSDLIYAGFMQAYGIDLVEQRGRLDWQKFVALFQGLPDNTRMREVMSIRGREIPIPTKYNQEEIRHLQELKRYWFLPNDSLEDNYQAGLSKLFDTLKVIAK